MNETPDETVLDEAVAKALLAEINHARTSARPAYTIPAEAQVKRIIAAAWPVLAATERTPR
jgi:hypothetical protein